MGLRYYYTSSFPIHQLTYFFFSLFFSFLTEGLPSDELSVQNGIFTTRSTRWPLCIGKLSVKCLELVSVFVFVSFALRIVFIFVYTARSNNNT
jgi:ATP-binding dynein motor region